MPLTRVSSVRVDYSQGFRCERYGIGNGRKGIMTSEIFRFQIGNLQCTAVSDGTLTYTPPTFPPPATLLFANAPKESLAETLRDHNLELERWAEWTSPYICLVVTTPEHQVLVDTGAGGLAPTTGKLQENMEKAGISPDEIDVVILTHGHPDHIGGIIKADDQLAFPNARFVMWKDEWDFWTSGKAEEELDEHVKEVLVACALKNLPSIQSLVNLVEDEREIIPGMRTISAPGHTPGHMGLEISSEGSRLLCISDAALHPIHLEQPGWYAAVDFAPEQAISSRRRLLDRAANTQALVLAFHFPFPGLGRVIRKGEAWYWQPIEDCEEIQQMSNESRSLLPAKSGKELALEYAALVASAMPTIGGPLSNILSGMAGERRLQRIAEAFEGMAEGLRDFKSEVSDSYVQTEEFEELLEETLQKVSREHSQEKRRIYRDFLLGVIKSPGEAYDEQLRFLRTLEELQGDHIKILRAFMEAPDPHPPDMGSIRATLKKRLPNMDENRIGDLVSQLEDLKILTDASFQGMMTGRGAERLASRITSYGSRLTAFIKAEDPSQGT